MNYTRSSSMRLIILLGVVSLFGDITYEGGRSVIGPYMAFLGASAATVGLVAGLGEFAGYALRLLFGYFADRTKAYWTLTFIGYGLMLAIPFLAFCGNWQLAALLIILERLGKAVRSPARDAILSYATKEVGRGWGFAVHEAMDQIGAILGPFLFSAVLFLKGGYRQGYLILFIPALLTLAVLYLALARSAHPEALEDGGPVYKEESKPVLPLSKVFWFYALFTFFCVAGFSNFHVLSYHFKSKSVIPDIHIPLFYMTAMAVDGVVALITGKIYDKIGLRALFVLPVLTLPIPFLGFSSSYVSVFLSIILLGAVLGIHETVMRAAIADITHIQKRGTAYGIFNAIYGLAWFTGSISIGALYDKAAILIPVFVAVTQALSIPFLLLIKRYTQDRRLNALSG